MDDVKKPADLNVFRTEIEDIDRQIAALFEQRMNAVRGVAEYKKARGLEIYDPVREEALIRKNSALISDPEIRAYYIPFLRSVMANSRRYQHQLLSGARIAYSGVEGAFAHMAAEAIFPDGELLSCADFQEVYRLVSEGEADLAVLPLENSYAGEVGQVMDLLFKGSLYVNGVYALRVSQNLIGLPGTSLQEIENVISHPQALEQCSGYIRKHAFRMISDVNTASAAMKVAEMQDRKTAAIASSRTAELYGLEVLDHDINESAENTTRFAVLSRVSSMEERLGNGRTFVMMFTVRNEAGALSKAINVIGNSGYNMKVLRSRPDKDHAWQFYFYIEAEGDAAAVPFREMTELLRKYCLTMKVLGSYEEEKEINDSL